MQRQRLPLLGELSQRSLRLRGCTEQNFSRINDYTSAHIKCGGVSYVPQAKARRPTSSRVSPPLGALPSQPDSPEVQLPPPEPDLPPIQAIPMTDGTPAACMQKNAKEFLAGNTPGVMAQYAPGLFTEQKRNSRQPAPDDPEAVKELVRLREEEPYG